MGTLSELHGLVITVTGLSSVTMAFSSTYKAEKTKKASNSTHLMHSIAKSVLGLEELYPRLETLDSHLGYCQMDQPGYRCSLVYKVKMN